MGSSEGLVANEEDETEKSHGLAWTQLILQWWFFILICLDHLKTFILGLSRRWFLTTGFQKHSVTAVERESWSLL